MEKIVEQGLLYDFYGELLTAHQRKVYEDVVFNDLSPSEIAGEVEQLADECARTRDMALIEQIHGLAGKITGTL